MKHFLLSLQSHNRFYFILCFLLMSVGVSTQSVQPGWTNPLLPMRDGAIERFMGKYYATGEAVKGNVYYTEDLIHWSEPVKAVSADEATWLKDPRWSQSYTYKEFQAADLIYRNGVFHTYWNGIGHAYSPTPLGPYKESSINAPFDDYGIDVQVFQDEDGEIYWVKKRNGGDPHPLTGAASDIDGPEVWTFRMVSPFSRWDITDGSVQLTNQRGHPTSVNHHNFEGPELAKYRGRYYLFFASNRMGPRSGMYQIGVAESDRPMNFDNSKKYPHPVLARNTERHLQDYKLILNSAEHGGWDATYQMNAPSGDWTRKDFQDDNWATGQGGFGRHEYDLFAGRLFTNAKIRARKTNWDTEKIFIRRKFQLTEIPHKPALKYWVYANTDFYINGNKITINKRNHTYGFLPLAAALFNKGENIIAVEAASPCDTETCQQFVDFGLYDTGEKDAEDIVVGPAQPNFVVGPNGFERWMMYKAYFDNKQHQGIDRIHFYDKEVVVENSTVNNTTGFRRKPAMPQLFFGFDKPDHTAFEPLNNSQWKIADGVLSTEKKSGGDLLIRNPAQTNYRFEVPFSIKNQQDRAGVYAFYQDAKNWLKITIGKDKTWNVEINQNGKSTKSVMALPEKFAFLESHPLVAGYENPWHTLTIYKNGNRFRIELDQFNLTLSGDIISSFSGKGQVGLTASSNQVDFDAVQYTMGWDEYDIHINGWDFSKGKWSVSERGITQSATKGTAATFKGDATNNYEFSTYVRHDALPVSGKSGFYPLFVDEKNYVRMQVNYADKTVEIEGEDAGKKIRKQSFPLERKVLKYYTYAEHPTNEYRYDFSHESVISGLDILWFEGEYPYLNQIFDLPQSVKLYALQNGEWQLLNATLEGELRFSYINKFIFSPVKTKAIKMVVENQQDKYARAFSAWFTEELTAGYFLRCRRESNSLHLLINDQYLGEIKGNWNASKIGLYTEKLKAHFNGMLFYQTDKQ